MARVSRIQLLLPADVHEEKKKIWFFIEPSIETISELVQSIKFKVPIPEACTLYLEDAVLPEYETIQILRDGETVRATCSEQVTAVVKEASVRKKKKHKDREVAEHDTLDTTVETPVKKKRKSSRNHEEPSPVRMRPAIVKPVAPFTVEIETPEAETTFEDSAATAHDVKQKRRRRRHHKKKTDKVEDFPLPAETTNVLPALTTTMVHHKSNHIRFAEPETVEEDKSIEESKQCEPMRSNIEPIVNTNNTNPLAALTALKSAVFVRSPSVNSSPGQVPAKTNESDSVRCTFRPENFSMLTSQPRPGDVIAFKVLELGENYTPHVSEYYQAQVTSVSPFGDISLSLRNKPSGNRNKNGKFELVWDEEGAEPSSNDVTYQWSELIEPRLLQC